MVTLARKSFSRAQRVRKRADFVRIQGSRTRVTTRHLLLLFARRLRDVGHDGADGLRDAASGDVAPARLGVVASRKVGPAVVRNRDKRLVREVFRHNQDMFPPGVDVVVIVRPGTHELSCAALEAEVRQVRSLVARRTAELLRGPREAPRSSYETQEIRETHEAKRRGHPR